MAPSISPGLAATTLPTPTLAASNAGMRLHIANINTTRAAGLATKQKLVGSLETCGWNSYSERMEEAREAGGERS